MATLTGDPRGLYPDQTFVARDVVPESLIYQLTTVAGDVEGDVPALRVPFVAEDPTSGFVPEGEPITESNAGLDEVLVNTQKLAVVTKMSNEAARYGQAAQIIGDSMSRSVRVKADTALLSNGSDPTGLLATAGITDAGTLAADNLDVIGSAITAIEVAGGQATDITTDPASWGLIRSMKAATDSAVPLLGAPADQTERRLFGVPVHVSPQMEPGTLLVSDRSQIVAAVGPLMLARSDDAHFVADSVARRVTWRIGWGVVRPDRLAKVSVTLPGGE